VRPTDPRRKRSYNIPNLARGQTTKNDDVPPKESKTVYTTEREDGILVAHESRPVGFGPQIEEWSLDLGQEQP
jgi:hypothetical protein